MAGGFCLCAFYIKDDISLCINLKESMSKERVKLDILMIIIEDYIIYTYHYNPYLDWLLYPRKYGRAMIVNIKFHAIALSEIDAYIVLMGLSKHWKNTK